ncbi:helix-turn-helix domain-containing protein [Mycobacteroides abscessus]|uniref:helix-turn-helix domain-containing protein n=1 Tax=Mycobacteroides abscessus TaxID=36809 RepID=UPI00266EFD3B|nr:helix-turn-helix domain-containing protein [Mycobacteroides abscessus]MDO3110469.1 helix-turn-helix domain-containing protein [Mycobacteroides abscessus subsp. abscessus]
MTAPTNPALPQTLTVEDLCEAWRVSPDSIRNLIKARSLKAYRVGTQFRITVEDALDYFNGNLVTGEAA